MTEHTTHQPVTALTSVATATTDAARPQTRPAARFDGDAVAALAEVVDRDGLDAHAATLFALAERASLVGVSPVLVDVMLGAGEPYVARMRAFTRVGMAVASARAPRTASRAAHALVAA